MRKLSTNNPSNQPKRKEKKTVIIMFLLFHK